jgi:hypothetical protein
LVFALAACGSSVDGLAIVASNGASIGVGEQRIMISITDRGTGEYLASPDGPVTATLRDRIGSPLGEYEGEFTWVVPESRGMYVFYMDIPGPGTFQITVEGEAFGSLAPVGIVTQENPAVVGVGEEAPPSVTRTSSDYALGDITTDPDPDPSFYELTVAEAVEAGPSVIVFGTPAWCTSQSCGPLLDQVKALSTDYPDLNYVHVEPYENINAESFQDLVLISAVEEWSLPSEPWVFVTDADGVVSAAFEGAASDGELSEAFASVSG